MKEVKTNSGKTYSVHTSSGCTVSDKNGWSKTIDAPDGYFTAHAGEVTIDGDDAADVREVFKLAPYQKLRLLGVVGGNAGGLPAGYKRVEYLESTGRQWIDTLLPCVGYIDAKMKFQPLSSGAAFVFGSQIDPNYNQCGVLLNSNSFNRRTLIHTLDVKYYTYSEINSIYEVEYSSQKCTINGESLAREVEQLSTIQEINTISLFARKQTYGTFHLLTGRIYYIKITNEQGESVEMHPCLDPTGAPCMFDLVNKQPYYNVGTGDFLYPTETATYSLRRVLPDWGKLTEYGLRRLYHAPANYKGELHDYALENGYKPIVEEPAPEEGYWSPRWTETADEIVLEWVETEPPMDEYLTNN